MSSFLFYDPRPQYRKADGTLCANGSLTFTLTNTSDPSDVYADSDLSTNLGNVITLGADARSPTPLWGDSTIQYRIELQDSLGATVADYPVDDVSGADFGAVSIPDPTSGDAGDVLSTTGSVYELRAIREVPDGTGHDNAYLSTVANVSQWVAFPDIPDPVIPDGGVTVNDTTTVLRIGTWVEQSGSGTMAASGGISSSQAIVFASNGGIAMDSCEHVSVTPTNVLGVAFSVPLTVTAKDGTGFTVMGSTNNTNGSVFTGTLGFTYLAKGTKAIDP
jgi:hypothetical protein